MKTLLLMRHAKSSWSLPLNDHQRPLTLRGVKNAIEMGYKVAKSNSVPDVILSSSAVRAFSTAQLVLEQLPNEIPVHIIPEIYESSVRKMLSIVNEIEEQFETVLLIGHNPIITMFTEYLCGISSPHMKTASIHAMNFDGKWCEISGNNCNHLWFDFP